jgi:hypothetical protein
MMIPNLLPKPERETIWAYQFRAPLLSYNEELDDMHGHCTAWQTYVVLPYGVHTDVHWGRK